MISCFDVAKYFLSLTDEESGDLISNLKLQKLVYYAQGFHLAFFDTPLFTERIEAWTYGPVVPDLYHAYKDHGACSIPAPPDFDISKYDSQTKDLLNEVYKVFAQFSAWKLQEMTHEEPPWKNAHEKGAGAIINHESLKKYFKTLVENEEEN
jgi:uncharacterized phage-associated protein